MAENSDILFFCMKFLQVLSGDYYLKNLKI